MRLLPRRLSLSDFHSDETDPGSVFQAVHILSNLDETEKPCDNFYQFACGGWEAKQIIPEDKNYISSFSKAENGILLKLKFLLEKRLTGNETHFIRMLKKTYDSCMNLAKIERQGNKPLKRVLKKMVRWPLSVKGTWKPSFSDWLYVLIQIRKWGYSHNIFIHLSVADDFSPDAAHIIQLDQPTLGIDRKHLLRGLNDTSTKVYYELMLKVAYVLSKNDPRHWLIHHENNRNLKNVITEIFDFETKLANISLPPEERRNLRTHYTVKELIREVPEIDWFKYLNGLLDINITESEPLNVMDIDYIKNFAHLVNETDQRIVVNYMMWRVVHESLPMLSWYWRTLSERSSAKEIIQEPPRWKYCLSTVTENFGLALSSYYLRHYFKQGSKESVEEIYKYIKQEIIKTLENLYWMEERDKIKLSYLINSTKANIAFPRELLNDSFMSNLYKNLSLDNEHFFFKLLMLRKWSTDYSFSMLRKRKIGEEWKKYANIFSVGYFYKPLKKLFELPAGILQRPFYDKDWPNYLNFGAIFNLSSPGLSGKDAYDGSRYWSQIADTVFYRKVKCFVEQYQNYTSYANEPPEFQLWVNDTSTKVEYMVDSGSLETAYLAYQSWVNGNEKEKKLPGVKYTQNQLFWISAANVLCEKQRKMNLQNSDLGGSRIPPMFRVIGAMSNLPQFARDFNCPANTAMNRSKKCRTWNEEYEI
ncbi:neprilysin-2-like [Stegodyphus dumicola]|uniref:neprilysin-2-like n=1 Tax=Stegodyphus dumicola TaxID=202533 RepID=UPI0015B0A917|nr:neprilysin-2-like [Stegodyphus dumicola]